MSTSVPGSRWKFTLGLAGLAGVAALVMGGPWTVEEPARSVAPAANPDAGESARPAANPDAGVGLTGASSPPAEPEAGVAGAAPDEAPDVVEVVICLDTSGSMSALLDTVRHRLWEIVDEVDRLAPEAELRVALLTFGSPGIASAEEGYVVVRSDLTDDLDQIYAAVMELSTSGGDEYVGWVVHSALEQLSWSSAQGVERILFVAGNESADQGKEVHDFRVTVGEASERGIRVNAMFAGGHSQGVHAGWQAVALAGEGMYVAIDKQRGTVDVATPYDDDLSRLNDELNSTYVPYGEDGRRLQDRMVELDNKARSLGARGSGSRFGSKGSGKYKVESWELVDAVASGRLEVDRLKQDKLPAELRGLSEAQLSAALAARGAERDRVKADLRKTSTERAAWLADWEAKQGAGSGLDDAIRAALRQQIAGS